MTNDNDNERTRMIKEKIDFFMAEKVKVHIKLKDKTFLNGIILKETSRDGVYWLQESKLGEIALFLSQVHDLMEYGKEVRV